MIWTLWLVTFGSVIGQGGAPAIVTEIATYQSQADCNNAIIQNFKRVGGHVRQEKYAESRRVLLRRRHTNQAIAGNTP